MSPDHAHVHALRVLSFYSCNGRECAEVINLQVNSLGFNFNFVDSIGARFDDDDITLHVTPPRGEPYQAVRDYDAASRPGEPI
ncbi:hypothetical protein [Paraburkholderia acidisoli]|uniref:Uncharacterized protein n=1 Tax=Paraburkholderia acidisoli TaxID=2571748 RepID=A0A7Z2GN17_9BURK|nr:hypothetical protein [Paraburkholderia acidisoli]QGZ64816.1 hypothetical protein FAZ98_23650 [Paraburkholderia acidisoli]